MTLDYLLISATKMEQYELQNRMDVSRTVNYFGRPSYHGKLSGKNILLVEGGIGLVNTAAILAMVLTSENPTVILQFGIGGAYERSGLNIGDIAIATEECYGEAGVLTPEAWLDMEEMGFPMIPAFVNSVSQKDVYNTIPVATSFPTRYQTFLEKKFKDKNHQVVTGPFVTVQQCSGRTETGNIIAGRFNGICENMEGVAAAHVSFINKLPFVEIRSISNLVTNRDLSQWDIKLAIQRCQKAVEIILEHPIT